MSQRGLDHLKGSYHLFCFSQDILNFNVAVFLFLCKCWPTTFQRSFQHSASEVEPKWLIASICIANALFKIPDSSKTLSSKRCLRNKHEWNRLQSTSLFVN